MPSGDTNDNIRGIKRAYRKKAFQTGYSQKGDAVNPVPVPYSSYSTETSVATSPQRVGIDPATYKRPVRPAIENLNLHPNNVNSQNYPWHLVPKSNSANVIQRQVVSLTGLSAGFLDAGEYIDAVVVNVNDARVLGTQTWVSGAPAASTLPDSTVPTFPSVASTSVGGQVFNSTSVGTPTGARSGGGAFTGVTTTGSTTATEAGRKNELYLVSRFGHTEPTTNGSAGVKYQIWVDGELLFEWDDFQWSVVVPQSDQWEFEIPLVVEKQIVFRVINTGSVAATDTLTGNVQAVFVGWSEQQTGFTDTGRQALEGGV
jgi:hypothetical protein